MYSLEVCEEFIFSSFWCTPTNNFSSGIFLNPKLCAIVIMNWAYISQYILKSFILHISHLIIVFIKMIFIWTSILYNLQLAEHFYITWIYGLCLAFFVELPANRELLLCSFIWILKAGNLLILLSDASFVLPWDVYWLKVSRASLFKVN